MSSHLIEPGVIFYLENKNYGLLIISLQKSSLIIKTLMKRLRGRIVMRKRILILVALVIAFSNSAAILSRQLVSAIDYGNPNITLCHAGDNASQPYGPSAITSDADSIMKRHGHSNHHGPIAPSVAVAQELKDDHDEWGDIIPAFFYGEDQYFPGLNNTAQGLAMIANGCQIVKTTPMSVQFVNGSCDVTAGYTIPVQTGVEYFVGAVKQTTGFHSVLASGSVTITAQAAYGYTLLESSTKTWTFSFTVPDPADCVLGAESVRPLPVTFVDNDCIVEAGYTIPSTIGVKYFVNGSLIATTAGVYTVDSNTTINVLAVADEGYIIDDGAAFSWSHIFTIPSYQTCHPDVVVTPAVVTFTDASCEIDASYVIPSTVGVEYYVDDVLTTAGTYYVTENTTISIRAEALTGYVFSEEAISTWSHIFTIPSYLECNPLVTVTPLPVTFTGIACDADGTYTIPSVLGVEYYIGETKIAAGTYTVSINSAITITAMAAEGYQLADVIDNWSYTYTVPAVGSCVLGAVSTTPAPVLFTPATCTTLGYYVIPSTTGIKYYIDGKVVAAGKYESVNGKTVTVTAIADLDYEIKEGATNRWVYSFVAPTNCGEGGSVLGATSTLPLTGQSVNTTIILMAIVSFAAAVISFVMRRLSLRRTE